MNNFESLIQIMGAIESGFEIGLADEISRMLVSGEWQRLPVQSAIQTPEPTVQTQEISVASTARKNFLRRAIFENFDFSKKGELTKEELEQEFYKFFSTEKKIRAFLLKSDTNELQNIASVSIWNTTITDAHAFANNEFDFHAREMGKNPFNSPEYLKAKEEADFWSVAEEVSQGAVNFAIAEGFEH